MENFFAFHGVPTLGTFSTVHIITMMTLLLFWILTILLIKILNRMKGEDNNRAFRYTTAVLLVVFEAAFTVWHLLTGNFSVTCSLPLHLCDITAFTCAVMLVNENMLLFQINYFAGVSGAVQAIVTPTTLPAFPHFDFLDFFITHALLILSVLYMIFIRHFRPDWKTMFKVILIANAYMVIIYYFNKLTGSNYLYVNHPPNPPNLIDPLLVNIFGPSPYYIAGMEILVFIIYSLMMLPFEASRIFKRAV